MFSYFIPRDREGTLDNMVNLLKCNIIIIHEYIFKIELNKGFYND